MSRTRKGSSGPWWLSPAGTVGLIVPFTLALAAFNSDGHFRASWRTGKFLTSADIALFAAAAAVFVVGLVWPMLLRRNPRPDAQWPGSAEERHVRLTKAAGVLFWATMFGYISFLVVGAARGVRPADLITFITKQDAYDSPLRTYFAPVAGLTTFTQVGIAYVIVAALLLKQQRSAKVLRRVVLVVFLGLLRALFLSERLALIELAVPVVAVVFAVGTPVRRRSRQVLLQLGPVLFLPLVIGAFGVFEYFRSWVFYSALKQQSFLEFMLDRLAGYYATAYNNGALALQAAHGIPRLPYQSVEVLWTAPGVGALDLYGRLSYHISPTSYDTLLMQHANPEFNSPGGLAIPFLDYGTVGGFVFLLLVGSLIGLVYRELRDGTSWATLLYPLLVTGLFELPRYLYWAQGRITPALLGLVLTHWWMKSAKVPPSAAAPAPELQDAHGR
ncbi:oligosaccharide repeat unit polymerase [Microlunatus antarcticus]|uniref:Oligosaccharide repeat unit polymerase n=1 Tax=Microlunatus antarcticus TaxID=53388 RepID=A0A7W5JU19_9ACTN|nr:oligosaccharide repeat unit polymerase [Microlunatus antarcticus]MBB3326238.1 hypothetical protein [Microlunatus antarcticus]